MSVVIGDDGAVHVAKRLGLRQWSCTPTTRDAPSWT